MNKSAIKSATTTNVEMTEKYWRMVDAVSKIVKSNDGDERINPISSIPTSRFIKYYKASKQFTAKDRNLGLSSHYYDAVLDISNASSILAKAKSENMSVDDVKAYVKQFKPRYQSAGDLKSITTPVSKLKFNNGNKNTFVHIVTSENRIYSRIGNTCFSKPDIKSIEKAMTRAQAEIAA